MNAAPNAVVIGFLLSLLLATSILLLVAAILRRAGTFLWRIIRDDKGWPSVARWHFALWTVVVLFVFARIYFRSPPEPGGRAFPGIASQHPRLDGHQHLVEKTVIEDAEYCKDFRRLMYKLGLKLPPRSNAGRRRASTPPRT